MTMLSFRLDDADAEAVRTWSERLGIDRSELLREAVRRHMFRLAAEHDAARWEAQPLEDGERAFAGVAEWGPAEDWADWSGDPDAAG